MKQTVKTWLIAAAALVLVGVVAFTAILALNHWSIGALGGTGNKEETVSIDKKFVNLSVKTNTENVFFMPSADGKCKVIFSVQPNVRCTASVQGDTLSIETVTTRNRSNFFSFSTSPSQIMIVLPRNEYADLLVEESTGKIDIPGNFTFASIRLSAETGDIACSASSRGLLQVKTDTGEIRLEGLAAGDLDVSVSTGKTVLTDIFCKSLASRGNTGDVILKNVLASEMLSVERSTGKVRLERCDAAELLITTDTGDVTGSLLSEKVFIVRSDTGRINVPETVTGGKCKIVSDTGDITISLA